MVTKSRKKSGGGERSARARGRHFGAAVALGAGQACRSRMRPVVNAAAKPMSLPERASETQVRATRGDNGSDRRAGRRGGECAHHERRCRRCERCGQTCRCPPQPGGQQSNCARLRRIPRSRRSPTKRQPNTTSRNATTPDPAASDFIDHSHTA